MTVIVGGEFLTSRESHSCQGGGVGLAIEQRLDRPNAREKETSGWDMMGRILCEPKSVGMRVERILPTIHLGANRAVRPRTP